MIKNFFEKLAKLMGGDMSFWETHTPKGVSEVTAFHETRNIHFLVADLLPVLIVVAAVIAVIYVIYRIVMWRLDKAVAQWEIINQEDISYRAYRIWRVKGFDPRQAHPLLKIYFFIYRGRKEVPYE